MTNSGEFREAETERGNEKVTSLSFNSVYEFSARQCRLKCQLNSTRCACPTLFMIHASLRCCCDY